MTRDEWIALPPALALRMLWDALPEGARAALEDAPPPQVPRAPKYDNAIYRKDGITWASEYDAEGLRYWRNKASQSTDPKYADKDAKTVKALDFWIEYRAYHPTTLWTGERNRQTVTAAAPCAKPRVYPRDESRFVQPPERKALPRLDDDAPRGGATDDEIPFARFDPPSM